MYEMPLGNSHLNLKEHTPRIVLSYSITMDFNLKLTQAMNDASNRIYLGVVINL